MTSAATFLAPSTTTRDKRAKRSVVEFLVVGGATLLLFPLGWLLSWSIGLDTSELVVGFLTFHAVHLINDPHFTVTYFLFYRDAKKKAFGPTFAGAQRIRFLLAGFVVPVALAAWGLGAIVTHSPTGLGLMMQLMFFLVGWHYVKQGFGVLTVLSARRGARFSARERTLILAHCLFAWLYARASPFDPGSEYVEQGVVFRSLPHPPGLESMTRLLFWASTAGLVWALAEHWRRERRLPALAPLVGFLVTVWLWVVYSSIDPLMVYLIPALHSVQYFYFVWLMRKNEARAFEGPPHFGRPASVRLGALAVSAIAIGWLLFHGAPAFVDTAWASTEATAAGNLGPTPFLAAFVTFVNLHHYFMDAVIWRRDNPDTRYLRDNVGPPEA